MAFCTHTARKTFIGSGRVGISPTQLANQLHSKFNNIQSGLTIYVFFVFQPITIGQDIANTLVVQNKTSVFAMYQRWLARSWAEKHITLLIALNPRTSQSKANLPNPQTKSAKKTG